METININGREFTIKQLKELISPAKVWLHSKLLSRPSVETYYQINSYADEGFHTLKGSRNVLANPLFVFKREEDANNVAFKCNLMAEMTNFAIAHNDGWKPDWSDYNQLKFGIFAGLHPSVCEISSVNPSVFGIVVKSKRIAELMLKEFKEKLGIYIL